MDCTFADFRNFTKKSYLISHRLVCISQVSRIQDKRIWWFLSSEMGWNFIPFFQFINRKKLHKDSNMETSKTPWNIFSKNAIILILLGFQWKFLEIISVIVL